METKSKINIMKSTFIIITLFLSLNSCSTDDNNKTVVEPITIDLTGLEIDIDDTNFSVNNYNFNIFRTVSSDPFGNDMDDSNNGISLAYPDGNSNPSTLELDLSSVNGLSKVTISIINNCFEGCTAVQTLNSNSEVLQELNNNNTVPTGMSDLIIENINNSINSLKISSFETTVFSIKLE